MLRFCVVLFSLIGGYSYHANAATLEIAFRNQNSPTMGCPYADDLLKVSVSVAGSTSNVELVISCGTDANNKTEHYRKTLPQSDSIAVFNIDLSKNNMTTGELCTAEASVDNTQESGDFTVGYKQIKGAPPLEITGGGITAGKEFRIEKLHFTDEVPFYDLLLRECTATEDPWIFWAHDDKLERVYPTSTNSEHRIKAKDQDPTNDNHCLGAYDGVLDNLFTIGENHTGCKIKLVKEDVTGGDQFTEQTAPTLDTAAAVTLNNGKVFVHTGSKPSSPANIGVPTVYISTNRGFTWEKSSTITAWTTAATDSGISAADSSTDNTRNMAMIKLTDGTDTWWRISKGQ